MPLSMDEQYRKVYKYCYFKIGNATLAEDLTQETFLKYFSHSSYIDRGKGLAYLYTIARNLCIDAYKSRTVSPAEESITERDEIKGVELQIAVRQALQLLPSSEQELVLLRYVNDLSVDEICRITGLSRFAVYRRTRAALAQLKSVLRKEDFLE